MRERTQVQLALEEFPIDEGMEIDDALKKFVTTHKKKKMMMYNIIRQIDL